jgi:hypothetical protein
LRVHVIGVDGPLAEASASITWHSNWNAVWTPDDSFGWESRGPTNEDGYIDFRGLPPGVPFVARASSQPYLLRMKPLDASETRVGLNVQEVVDLHSGLQEVRILLPTGSIRCELDVDRTLVMDAELMLGIARAPDFILDPSAPITRLEKRWVGSLRYMWNHAPIHIWQRQEQSWRGRALLFQSATPGTYRAWACEAGGRLRWASELFEVGEGSTDLGKIQLRPNHSTKISVHGFPELDPRDFANLSILAERVPEGNASDEVHSIDDDFSSELHLLEGDHKLSLWYSTYDSWYQMAESEPFEVTEATEFIWKVPAEAFAPLLEARARWDAEEQE